MKIVQAILSFVLTGAFLFGFYEISNDYATSAKTLAFDAKTTRIIQSYRAPWLDFFMKFITYSGGIVGVTMLTAVLFFGLRAVGRVDDANFSAVLVIIGTILAGMLKKALGRVRPEQAVALISLPSSSSFPSGHSMASMCLATAAAVAVITSPSLVLIEKSIYVALCAIYAILVGISRVYLGVHWPSDVVAAWFLGGAWVAFATGLNRVFLIGREHLPLK